MCKLHLWRDELLHSYYKVLVGQDLQRGREKVVCILQPDNENGFANKEQQFDRLNIMQQSIFASWNL